MAEYTNDLPFGENVADDKLVDTINTWIKDSQSFHDLMLKRQNEAVKYYHGDQTEKGDIAPFNSDSVYNRLFEATETIIPIITGSAHQFIAIPGEENELSIKKARKVQQVLTRKYEDLEVQKHLENGTRDIILKRFGVLKYFWNVVIDDVDVTTIDPRLILIPKLRLDPNDVSFPYVLELQEYDREGIEANFPDIDPDDLTMQKTIQSGEYQTISSIKTYQVIEAWTNEYVCWKQGGKILKKTANPYFDFEGEEEEVLERTASGKVKRKKFLRLSNHLDRPEKPFIFLNPFCTGDAPVAETSLAEVAMPIQDDINTAKRSIIDNIKRMGNGQVYVDSDAMPKEMIDQITSEPGLILVGKGLASENRIRRDPGVPLPNSHFQNLLDSIQAFDNVFGVHRSLRGESSGGQTLGGQILNRQQDLSRVEQLTRVLNRGVARLADGLVQLMKMYYDGDHVFKILGKDGSLEFIKFSKGDIEDDVIINVKSGVPPMLDPVARFNQAIQLWQLNALDPETLFERLDFSDPQLTAKKLAAWKTGQLLLESQIRQQEAGAEIVAKAGAEAEQPRDVETSNDMMGRAQEGLSPGGRAPLTNTPNQ